MRTTERTWKIAADTYRLHLATPPDADGIRRAACGQRFRALDVDPPSEGERADQIGLLRCRDCDQADAIQHDHNIYVAL